MFLRILLATVILGFGISATARGAILEGALEQGGLAIGKTEPGAIVSLDGTEISVDRQGRFLLGFARNAPASMTLSMHLPSGQKKTIPLSITPRQWDIQKIDGLPEAQVSPNPAVLERIKRENALIAATRKKTTFPAETAVFPVLFSQPVEGRISGVFGSQRILNGQARSPHSGLDIAAPQDTPVMAAADGTIRMVQPDLYYTGMTVMIDHGHSLFSLYAHMSSIAVTEGQSVTQGMVIGTIGMTGRATGPHLHWGVSWQGTNLDPQTVLRILETSER